MTRFLMTTAAAIAISFAMPAMAQNAAIRAYVAEMRNACSTVPEFEAECMRGVGTPADIRDACAVDLNKAAGRAADAAIAARHAGLCRR